MFCLCDICSISCIDELDNYLCEDCDPFDVDWCYEEEESEDDQE